MVWKSVKKMDIYFPGDVIPEEKALVWNKMWSENPPCVWEEDKNIVVPKEKIQEQLQFFKKVSKYKSPKKKK